MAINSDGDRDDYCTSIRVPSLLTCLPPGIETADEKLSWGNVGTRMGLASLFGTWMAQGLNPLSQCLAFLITKTSFGYV